MNIFAAPTVTLIPQIGALVPTEQIPAVPQIAGVVNIGVAFSGMGYGTMPVADAGSLVLEAVIDNNPTGVYITGPPLSYSLDTSKFSDGTHVITFRVIKSTSLTTYPATAYQCASQTILIANHPPVSVLPQRIPVGPQHYHSNIETGTSDWYNYPGHPLPMKSAPYPYPSLIPSANGDISFRDPSKYFVMPLVSVRHTLYTFTPKVYTTQMGGVVVQGYNPELTGGIPSAKPGLMLHSNQDGPRNVCDLDPYSTITEDPNGDGWWVIEAVGRLCHLDEDGSVRTVVGFKFHDNELMYDYRDWTVPPTLLIKKGDPLPPCDPLQDPNKAPVAPLLGLKKLGANCPLGQQLPSLPLNNEQLGQLGPCVCHPNDFPTDLCFDPRNHNIVYVCAYGGHTIVKIDITDQANPIVAFYAGTDGTAGYVDGPALSAQFNKPYSIQMTQDGTLYIADFGNNAVRAVSPDGSTVSTFAGGHTAGVVPPLGKITTATRDTYSAPGTVSLPATIPNPQCLRLDSHDNIVFWEGSTGAVRKLDRTARTITRLTVSIGVSAQEVWGWLDVDKKGTCGPVDDVLLTISNGFAYKLGNGSTPFAKLSIYRLPVENPANLLQMATNGFIISDGEARNSQETAGHYVWAIALSRFRACMMTMGYGTVGISAWRAKLATDPVYSTTTAPYQANYLNGFKIWKNGSVVGFPDRPPFSTLCGEYGHNYLGLPNFDDLQGQTDAQLADYIHAGFGGSVLRPEITGNDLRDLIYFIRRTSLQNGALHPAVPGPKATDITAPVISNPVITRTPNPPSLLVTWTTNEPAIGFVAWGTNSGQYYRASAIESVFGMQHSAIVSGIPLGDALHLCVVAKDVAGNMSSSVDLVAA